MRSIIEPKLRFCRDHNFILYLKRVLLKADFMRKPHHIKVENISDKNNTDNKLNSDSEFKDALSDIGEDLLEKKDL